MLILAIDTALDACAAGVLDTEAGKLIAQESQAMKRGHAEALMPLIARVVEQSGIGWTTLRATQFHDLILIVARALAKSPVIPAPPGFRFQPVDVTEVAGQMAELALGAPSGLVPDMAGPKIYTVPELVNAYLRAAGLRRRLVPLPIPGQAARAIRAGANLAPERAVGKRTWEEFLAGRI